MVHLYKVILHIALYDDQNNSLPDIEVTSTEFKIFLHSNATVYSCSIFIKYLFWVDLILVALIVRVTCKTFSLTLSFRDSLIIISHHIENS